MVALVGISSRILARVGRTSGWLAASRTPVVTTTAYMVLSASGGKLARLFGTGGMAGLPTPTAGCRPMRNEQLPTGQPAVLWIAGGCVAMATTCDQLPSPARL